MAGETPGTHPATARAGDPGARDLVLGRCELAAAGGLTAIAVVGTVAAFAQGWVPTSDDALIAMHVADVPAHLPLVGAWSRLGWSHPGPAQYYLLALPYRLSGSRPAGLMVGTLLIGLGGTVSAWLVARARDRTAGALVLLAMVAVMVGRDAVDLRDPWNPYVGVLLTATLVVLGWAAAERRAVGAVALLPLGSLLVQAHLGYVPVVGAVVLVAVIGTAGPGATRPRTPWRPWAWGVVITALMWLPPVIQQLTGDPGNLGLLLTDGLGTGEPVGPTDAVQLVAAAFAIPPTWLGGDLPLGMSGVDPAWTVPVLLLVPVAGLFVGIYRRNRSGTLALGVSLTAVAGMTVGVARITGVVHQYLFAGLGAVAAVSVGFGAWVLFDAVDSRRLQRSVCGGALGLAAVLSLVVAWNQVGVQGPYPSTAEGVGEIAPTLVEDARGEQVFLSAVPEFTAFAALPGFVLALEGAGVDVKVSPDAAAEFGEHRVDEPDGRTRYLVAFPGLVDAYRAQGWTLIGTYEPLPQQAAARTAALDAEFMDLKGLLGATIERGGDTTQLRRSIEENREQAYEVRAERFPLAVLREPSAENDEHGRSSD